MKNLTLSLSLSLLKEKCKKFITLRVTTHRVEQIKNFKKRSLIILTFSVLFSFLFVSLITYGATTIGSSINTGGDLTVSGNAILGDNSADLIKSIGSFYASSTLQTTGATRFYSTARIDGATILNSVSYTWPSSDGSASTYLQTNGAGTLSWATVSSGANSDWLKQTNFGVLNLTASTTLPYWAKDAIYASSTLQVQGLTTLTNASTTQTSVSSNFYTALTANSIPFIGVNGLLTQNTSNLIWDNTNTRLGIGTTTPNWLLQVAGTRPFFTLSDTGAAANNKHWFLSSQGGNFYVGTSSDAYATTSISALTITNGGNIGIATSSPSSGLFSVENVGTGYTFYATDSANDTTPFVIDENGRVGIQTLPSSSYSLALLTGTAGGSGGIVIAYQANTLRQLNFDVTLGESVDSGSTIQSIFSSATRMDLILDSDGLIFKSKNGSEAARIATSGLFGIGTSTPQWNLQIASTTKTHLALSDMSAGADLKHWFISSQGGNFYVGTSSDAYATSTSNLLNLISSNYSVGIGTTSPAEQLSVSGRLFVGGTGTSTIQNNLYVMGTLRSTVSYVGDLIFSNNFKFIETPQNAKIQSLFLQNQYGKNMFKIDEKGQLVVREIEAEKGNFKQGNFEEKLQIGSPQNRTGITIYDKKTGEPVCVFSENNVLKSSKGECK